MGSLPPLSPDLMGGPQAALSAGSGDLDHLWSFDDLLWDPFYWVASPVPPSTCGGAAGGQAGRRVVPTAAAPILQPALAPPRRGGKKLGGCLVPGCTTTRELTPYERRAMLCSQHLKAERVLVDGAFLRFCQKCRRLENLSAFDGTKRSCRARLEAVRAKRGAATGGLEQKSQTPPSGASVHRPARRGRGFQAQPTTGVARRGLANTAQVDVQALRSFVDLPSTGSHPYSPGGSTASLPGSLDTPETSLHPTLPPPALGTCQQVAATGQPPDGSPTCGLCAQTCPNIGAPFDSAPLRADVEFAYVSKYSEDLYLHRVAVNARMAPQLRTATLLALCCCAATTHALSWKTCGTFCTLTTSTLQR
jgi:SBP domain